MASPALKVQLVPKVRPAPVASERLARKVPPVHKGSKDHQASPDPRELLRVLLASRVRLVPLEQLALKVSPGRPALLALKDLRGARASLVQPDRKVRPERQARRASRDLRESRVRAEPLVLARGLKDRPVSRGAPVLPDQLALRVCRVLPA